MARQRASNSPVRMAHLDGLRALAAFWVLIDHAWMTVWPVFFHRQPTGIVAALTGWVYYAHFAVDLFIVLSGFCLMLPVVRGDGTLRGGAWAFFLKRARRILPPYYAALLLSVGMVLTIIGHPTGSYWDIAIPFHRTGFFCELLLLQDVCGAWHNPALWSISVEWRIYFAFPLIVLGWRRLGGVRTTILTVAAGYAAYLLLRHNSHVESICPWYLGLFALGACAAAITVSPDDAWTRWRKLPWGGIGIGLSALAACICFVGGAGFVFGHYYAIDLIAGLTSCALLIVSSRRDCRLQRFLALPVFVIPGSFAYSLYLIHAPLLQAFWQYVLRPLRLTDNLTFALLVIMGGPIVVGIAFLFHRAFERPFMSRPAPRTEREAEAAAIASPAP